MKKIEKVSASENYTAVAVGKFDDLNEYVYSFAPGVEIPGKVFVGSDLQSKGMELSFGVIPPKGGIGFVHSHRSNEEVYIVIKGSGEFMVDGNVFPVEEGSIVSISPNGKRAYRNTGDIPMTFMCIQVKANSLQTPGTADGIMHKEPLQWD